MEIRQRTARAEDKEFLYALNRTVYQTLVEQTIGRWNENAQRRFFEQKWNRSGFQIIEKDGIRVGAIWIDPLPDNNVLREIQILPEFQNQGIGSHLIRQAMRASFHANKPLRLRLVKNNRALSLYKRLGFVVMDESDHHIYMEASDPSFCSVQRLSLIEPVETMARCVVPMLDELGTGESGFTGLEKPLKATRFQRYVRRLQRESQGKRLPKGWVPMTTYWMVTDRLHPVGISRLRHALTTELLEHGGNIGYWVRPSERKQGYGTQLLRLTCANAKAMGISKVLVTCHRHNTASIKVIKRNGGELDPELAAPTAPNILHFWILLNR